MSDTGNLAKALSAFQAEVVTVGKSADNPFFHSKYAPLEEIMLAALPVLAKHGLSVMQLPDNLDGQPALTTIVMHESGESQRATTPLLMAKNDPQGQGSAITYLRRYSYAAALGIVIDADDDGNRASRPQEPTKPSTRPAVSTTPKPTEPAYITGAQASLLLARLRDKTGVNDKVELLDEFIARFGIAVNEVKRSEFDEVLASIQGAE